MSAAALRVRRRAERAAASLPPLLVAARRVAATVHQGVHGRRRPGPGETFWQFRRYEPGDPAAAIDWRQSARSARLYVREREWEASQGVWLWRDGSASMEFASAGAGETKKERASLLLLAVASLLLGGGERVALFGVDRRPARGAAALARFAGTLCAEPDPPAGPGAGLPPRDWLPRHAHAVLIGDFLDPPEAVDGAVRRLAGLGVAGCLLQVLDPAEETLPFRGRVRFSGLEGGPEPVIGRVEAARAEYRARLAAQRAALSAIARRAGWTFLSHRSDRAPETALLALYLALSARFEGAGGRRAPC